MVTTLRRYQVLVHSLISSRELWLRGDRLMTSSMWTERGRYSIMFEYHTNRHDLLLHERLGTENA